VNQKKEIKANEKYENQNRRPSKERAVDMKTKCGKVGGGSEKYREIRLSKA